jgi:purine-binding chemotaxis protein CheW
VERAHRPAATEIDWQAVRQRLAKAFVGTEEALRPSPEHTEKILQERARRLAQPAEEVRPGGATLSALAFTLGNERYGIETCYAREVLRLIEVTPVPGVPDFVVGVTSLRGDILVVFDLQRLFGRPSPAIGDRSSVIVCGETTAEFGILADAVHEVTSVLVQELVLDPAFSGEGERGCVKGVTRSAMTVLDGAALMRDHRLFIDH